MQTYAWVIVGRSLHLQYKAQTQQDRQCAYKRNIEARSRNYCYHGEAISITYSECVSVALVIQHVKRMRRIILSPVACPAVPYFSTLSHKRHDFQEKKKLFNMKCVFWFSLQLLSETFLILRKIQRDIINVHRSSPKVPVILVRFYWNLNFLDRVLKNAEISNFMKIRPVGAELFRADWQTDMTKLIVAFRNFANAPKTLVIRWKIQTHWHFTQ
jgi:hypothetical protein